MKGKSDRLTANRVCDLTGVRAQTRATWADRGFLRSAQGYGELDVIEQVVLKDLLAKIQKSHVPLFWGDVREHLRATVVSAEAMLVWDSDARRLHITDDDAALRGAVCHGRTVQVLVLGELVAHARRVYRQEVEARKRHSATPRKSGTKPGQAQDA